MGSQERVKDYAIVEDDHVKRNMIECMGGLVNRESSS